MSTYLLLVAGGTGSRMSSTVPKQFIELNGKPIIIHTLEKFLHAINELLVVIVIHPDWENELMNQLKKYFNGKSFKIVTGGETRFQSVKNGLSVLAEDKNNIVMIHDAARPFVAEKTIKNCLNKTRISGNAIPVIPVSESLRKTSGDASHNVDRQTIFIVQTPQCFDLTSIKKAFQREYQPQFTDDASVFEAAGHTIHLVEGNPENIKITHPIDLKFAAFLLHNSANS